MNNDFDSRWSRRRSRRGRRSRRITRVGVMLNAVKQCDCNKKPANPREDANHVGRWVRVPSAWMPERKCNLEIENVSRGAGGAHWLGPPACDLL